jgi:hypothetical protein
VSSSCSPRTRVQYKRIILEPVPSTDGEKKGNDTNQVCILEVSRMGSAYSRNDGTVGDHRMHGCSAVRSGVIPKIQRLDVERVRRSMGR